MDFSFSSLPNTLNIYLPALGWGTGFKYGFWLMGSSLGWFFLRQAPWSLQKKVLFGIFLLSFLTPPFLSSDPYNYTQKARLITAYGENPYLTTLPAINPFDPFLKISVWEGVVSPYGPVLMFLFLPMGIISFPLFR